MTGIKINIFVLLAFLSVTCSLSAQILNGSFEKFDGADVNDWNSIGVPPQICSIYTALNRGSNSVPIIPKEGDFFVVLESLEHVGDPNCTQLIQTIDVNAGECITGAYFFDAEDYLPYDDVATIKLKPIVGDPCSGSAEILLAQKRISDPCIGNYGSMLGWQTFSHTFQINDAGRYKIVLIIENGWDHLLPSFLLVDALKLCYPPLGDINHDCVVNFLDFAILADQWLNDCIAPTWCNNADLNPISEGSKVDFGDIMIMADNWLIDCDATPEDEACIHQ